MRFGILTTKMSTICEEKFQAQKQVKILGKMCLYFQDDLKTKLKETGVAQSVTLFVDKTTKIFEEQYKGHYSEEEMRYFKRIFILDKKSVEERLEKRDQRNQTDLRCKEHRNDEKNRKSIIKFCSKEQLQDLLKPSGERNERGESTAKKSRYERK